MRKKQAQAKKDAALAAAKNAREEEDIEARPALPPPRALFAQREEAPAPPASRRVRHSVVQRALNMVGADPKTVVKKKVKNTLDRKAKMDKILASPVLYDKFLDMSERYFAQESVLFWKAVDRFERYSSMRHTDPVNYAKMGQNIIDEFVKPGSPQEINISDEQRTDLLRLRGKFTPESFSIAKQEVTHMLAVNFLSHFIKQHDAEAIDQILDEVGTEEDQYETVEVRQFDEDPNINTLMGLGFTKQESAKTLKRFVSCSDPPPTHAWDWRDLCTEQQCGGERDIFDHPYAAVLHKCPLFTDSRCAEDYEV
jgi:hypothetical protein